MPQPNNKFENGEVQSNGQKKNGLQAEQLQKMQSQDSFNMKRDNSVTKQSKFGVQSRAARILQRMAYLPVPPETNFLLRSQSNPIYGLFLVFLGLFLLAAVCVWFFILFFIIFGSCDSVKTISTMNLSDDAECVPVTLPTYGTLIMDNRGSWITEAVFQQDKSIWNLKLFKYQSTRRDFQNSTKQLMIEGDNIADQYLQNEDWLTRVQVLAFTDVLKKDGIDNGTLTLNFDVDVTALAHDFTGFKDVFYDFSSLLTSGSGKTIDSTVQDQMVLATEGCEFNAWKRMENRDSGKTMSRFEKFGGTVNFGVFVPDDFSTAIIFNNSDCTQPIPANTAAPNPAQQLFRFNGVVPMETPGIDEDSQFMDVAGIPSVISVGEFRWDMKQVLHLDFCNKYGKELCNVDKLDMSGIYPTVQHPTSREWAYQWKNFTVVPTFYTPQGCQCDQQKDVNKSCHLLLGMFLHVYGGQRGDYVSTYSLQLQTTGMINTRLVSSPPHCTPYSPSQNYPIQNLNISIPDNLETGFYDCTVRSCMDTLERLASAQLNDELLFIIVFVLILLISVYIYHRIHINARVQGDTLHFQDTKEEQMDGVWDKFRSFTTQVFVSVLPQETGFICVSRFLQVLLGALLLFASFAAFIFFIFYLNQCDVNYIVSETDQSNGDNKMCDEMLLSTSGTFLLDYSGLWQTQTGFDPSKAYWILEFQQYEVDADGLQKSLREVRQQIDSLVDSVIGKNHIETTMRLLFNNIQVQGVDHGGKSGVIRVQPNMDLIPVNTWGSDLFFNLSLVLGSQQGKERVGQVQDECLAWRNSDGNALFVNQSPLGFYKYIYPDGMRAGAISGPLQNGVCPLVEVTQEQAAASIYPAFFAAFRDINTDTFTYHLDIDARQSYALSFCNQFPEDCSLAIDENRGQIKGSSNKLSTVKSGNGQWGYLWTTVLNPVSQNITFFIVPDVQPTYECYDDCNTDIECDQALVQMSHFYLYEQQQPLQITDQIFYPGSYLGTFSTLKGTTGKWNRKYSTDGPLQCQVDENLKFLGEAINSVNPYDPSKNLYSCEIKNCPSIFERLATAFGDVEFLFVAFIMLLLIVLMLLVGCYGSQEELESFIEVEHQPVAVYLTRSASKLADQAVASSKTAAQAGPPLQLQLTQSQMITGPIEQQQSPKAQPQMQRSKELSRHGIIQEVGLLFPAIQRVFELPVPENGHKVLVKRTRRRILGFLFFIILAAAFIYMVIRYIFDCHYYRSLTLDPSEGIDCQPSILSVSNEFYLDSSGKFSVEEDFNPQSSYWSISLDNYKADNQQFFHNLQNLTAQVDGFLAQLQQEADEQHFLYILQELFMFSKTVQGQNGTMTIQANIDLSIFMDNLLNFQPFSLHDPRTEDWKLNNTDNVDKAELNGIYDCNGTMFRQRFGRIYGEGRERFLATPITGLEEYYSWNAGQCNNGTVSFAIFDGQVEDGTNRILQDYREMYYGLNKLLGSAPNNQNNTLQTQQFQIALPLEDLLMVDFCRRDFQRCQEVIQLQVGDIDNPIENIGFDTLGYPSINVTQLQLSPYLPRSLRTDAIHLGNLDLNADGRVDLGMMYRGGWNPNAINRIQQYNQLAATTNLPTREVNSSVYAVIPSITPHTACFTCSQSRNIGWEECQRAVELRLEFLEYYPAGPFPPFRNNFYQFGLLYAAFRTDGYLNEFMSRGDLCSPSSFGFENVQVLNLSIPYAAESGLFNCEIKQCKGFFEIVGDAFGNVQELFVLVSMIMFVVFVFIEVCCLGGAS